MNRIAAEITLTEKQEKILHQLSKGRTVPAHLQQRATILLHCAQGKTNLKIMGELGVHRKTIAKWRTRWTGNQEKLSEIENQEQGLAYQRTIERILSDTTRSGTPPKFTAEQICQIIHVACESPQENDSPFNHCSLSSLADELAKRKIVERISTSQLHVFLKSGQDKVKQWIHTPIKDEETFNSEVKTVCDIYANATELNESGTHVISCDEKSGIQALEREITPMIAGQVEH